MTTLAVGRRPLRPPRDHGPENRAPIIGLFVIAALTIADFWVLADYWTAPHGLANAAGQPPPIELVILLHVVAALCACAWAFVFRRWARRGDAVRDAAARRFHGARSA